MHIVRKCKKVIMYFATCRYRKKNNDAKRNYFNSSNKWDAATDILHNDYKLHVMKVFQRTKRHYR